MTLTATPNEAAAEATYEPTPQLGPGWLNTADHKRLGVLWLATGLAMLAVGALLAAGEAFSVGADLRSRLYNARTVSLVFLSIAPAWIGLATYLVPLQIGSNRLALPRLNAFAYWAGLFGGIGVLVSFLLGAAGRAGLGISEPLRPIVGAEASTATQLWITSLALVAGAGVAASISIVATVATRRTDGMSMFRMPGFTWGALSTAAMTIVVTPTFLAGLALLYVDQRFGGSFFAEGTRGTVESWMHLLWVHGRPELWLLVVPALGAFVDIVGTAARRPVVLHFVACTLVALTAGLTLTAWMADKVAGRAVLLPNHSLPTLAIGAPLGLLLLLFAGTFRSGGFRFLPGMAYLPPFVLLLLIATANALISIGQKVSGEGSFEFGRGQTDAVIFGPAILGLLAAVVHWAPKMKGRPAGAAGMGGAALVFLGALVAAAGGWIAGYGNDDSAGRISGAGWVLIAVGVLGVLAALVAKPDTTDDDPYEGLTLEWATTSPPPEHNFDTIPDVRSEAPVNDHRLLTSGATVRTAAAATKDRGR